MSRKSNLDTSEVMFLRGIKKTAVILLLLIRMDRPLTAREAAHILDINYTTICTYFRRLSSANFVTKTRSGYILTQFGSQLLLPMDAPPDPERLKNMEIPYFPINSNTITTTINSSYKKDEDLIVVNNRRFNS
jgi:DNA-binding transcriptional regulator YhcF (GntR family)